MYYFEIEELNQIYLKVKEGKVQEALQNVIELEKRKNVSHKELLRYKLAKANLFRILGKSVEAIEICELIYPEFQKIGDLISSFDALLIQTYCYLLIADINKCDTLIKQANDLFKMITNQFSMNLKDRESFLVRIQACIHFFKGEIQKSLDLNKKAYELAKNTGDKTLISTSLGNIAAVYMQLEQFDKALEYAKSAVEVNCKTAISDALATLIEIYIYKGDLIKAEEYLNKFRVHIERRDAEDDMPRYIYSKALILKSSLRAKNRVRSEDLFRSLALDDKCNAEYRIGAIINLCDLYLTELKITNDLEIIDELKPLIQELLIIAQNQHSHSVLAETYLLQAKLSILTFNIRKAQEFLTQAQKIAESDGLKRIAMKISYEHDKLLRQTIMWEKLKASGISLSERLELTGLKEQLEIMVKRRIIEVPEFSDEEPVLLLIISEGGVSFFKKTFIEDKFTEDHLFGGFITSINAFIINRFSEGLDRASFGKYILIMKSITPFLVCYIFKGDSYYAMQRVKLLISKIESNEEVWQMLQQFYQQNRIIQKDDIPSLNLIVNKIFIEKSNPSD